LLSDNDVSIDVADVPVLISSFVDSRDVVILTARCYWDTVCAIGILSLLASCLPIIMVHAYVFSSVAVMLSVNCKGYFWLQAT